MTPILDEAKPEFHRTSFRGGVLARGFWLYVWVVRTPQHGEVLYVGRTGDSSSINAQSPYARMGQHLVGNGSANMLRRHLEKAAIAVERCHNFELLSYGPILPELKDLEGHQRSRDAVAALEKALCDTLKAHGKNVLNTVSSRKPLDQNLWQQVRLAFAEHFKELRSDSPNVGEREQTT